MVNYRENGHPILFNSVASFAANRKKKRIMKEENKKMKNQQEEIKALFT